MSTSQSGSRRQSDSGTARDPQERDVEQRTTDPQPAKTGAATAFALALGVAAFVLVLTVLLSPVALVLGILGIVLGIVGIQMARRSESPGRAWPSPAWSSA